MSLTCVSDDIVQHHKTFKLQLQLLLCCRRQRLGLELAQPEISIFVSINKELERPDLDRHTDKELEQPDLDRHTDK